MIFLKMTQNHIFYIFIHETIYIIIRIIKTYQKEDNRIILIENKKNKGTFASRNIGALKSKGQYIMFPDPDDIPSQDCLGYFLIWQKRMIMN